MFKKSNAFFVGIIEGIGKLLAPHKLFWSSAFAVWIVAVFVLRLFGLASDLVFTIWLWSIPFLGVYALMVYLDHIGYFEEAKVKKRMEKLGGAAYAEQYEKVYGKKDEPPKAEEAPKAANRTLEDKMRPDRR